MDPKDAEILLELYKDHLRNVVDKHISDLRIELGLKGNNDTVNIIIRDIIKTVSEVHFPVENSDMEI